MEAEDLERTSRRSWRRGYALKRKVWDNGKAGWRVQCLAGTCISCSGKAKNPLRPEAREAGSKPIKQDPECHGPEYVFFLIGTRRDAYVAQSMSI